MIHLDGERGETEFEGRMVDLLSEIAVGTHTLMKTILEDDPTDGMFTRHGMSAMLFSIIKEDDTGIFVEAMEEALSRMQKSDEDKVAELREAFKRLMREDEYGESEKTEFQKERSREEMGSVMQEPIRRRVGRSRRS